MPTLRIIVVAFAATLLLAACSGGSGQPSSSFVDRAGDNVCTPDDPANDVLEEDFLHIDLIMRQINVEESIGDLYLSDYGLEEWGWNSRLNIAEREDQPFLRLRELRELGVYGEWHVFGRQWGELTNGHFIFFNSPQCASAYFSNEIEGEELPHDQNSKIILKEKVRPGIAALLVRDSLAGGMVILLKNSGEGVEGSDLLESARKMALEYMVQTTPIRPD